MSPFGPTPPCPPEFDPDRRPPARDLSARSAEDPAVWLKHEIDRGVGSRPAPPITPAFWAALRRRVEAAGPADAD